MSDAKVDPTWPNPTRSPTFQYLYGNVTRTTLTPWDLTLTVGYTTPPLPDGQNSVQELVAIAFSPQQFKALATGLANAVAAYEEIFGTINVPSGFLQPLAAWGALRESMEKAAGEARKPP